MKGLIMKKLITFILLSLIAIPCHAEHHRDHALSYLEQIQPRIDIIQAFIVNFAARSTPTTHAQQLTYEPPNVVGGIFPENIDGIEQRIQQTIEVINSDDLSPMCYQMGFTYGQELECARRLINQPDESKGVRSALQFLTSATYGAATFVYWEDGCDPTGQWCSDQDLMIVQLQLNEIWAATQLALWHINDAINEDE